jgi:hypothetical protein
MRSSASRQAAATGRSSFASISQEELGVKLQMRDQVYDLLRFQLAPLLSGLPADHFATEVIAPAVLGASVISNEQILRYEWRARLLLERGEIARVITHADHYLPMVEALTHRARD